MAIEKNCFKVSRLDSEFLPSSGESMSSEGGGVLRRGSGIESDDDDMFDDCDSGAGSDDFDLLELGEAGEEFCQVGNQTCSIPYELYDLSGLGEILSMDVWNECLTEEERFSLTQYLPDMDQEMFMRTLKQLFIGSNLHFGSPLVKLFDMLKGGLCEPRVALYRQGLISFQKRQHCHRVRKYHNTMVVNLHQIRDAWLSCKGYDIEEKLQVLNIRKSRMSLMNEDTEELGSDASERNGLRAGFRTKKKNFASEGKVMSSRHKKLGKPNPKGTLKFGGTKTSLVKVVGCRFPSDHNGLEMMAGPSTSSLGASARQNKFSGYGLGATVPMRDQMKDDDETAYATTFLRGCNTSQASTFDKAGPLRIGKSIEGLRDGEYNPDYFVSYPEHSMKDLHVYGGNITVDKLSDIKVLTAKPSKSMISSDNGKKVKYPVKVQQYPVVEQMKYGKSQAQNSLLKGNQYDLFNGFEPFWHNKAHGGAFSADMSPKYDDHVGGIKNWKVGKDSPDYKFVDRLCFPEHGANISHGKIGTNSMQNGRRSGRHAKCEETDSDSSEPIDDDEDDNPLMRSKLAYPHKALNGSFFKSGLESKKAKISEKGKKGSAQTLDELSLFSRKTGRLHNSVANKVLEDGIFSGSGGLRVADSDGQVQKFSKKSHVQGAYSSGFYVPPLKSHPTGRKQKEEYGHSLHGYVLDDEGSPAAHKLVEDAGTVGSLEKKVKGLGTYGGFHEINGVSLSYPKWEVSEVAPLFDERNSNIIKSQQQRGNATSSRKHGKRKIHDGFVASEMGNSEPSVAEMVDVEREPRSLKKPFTPITPTIHSGFSFSVIHLLSAVRMAMVTLLPEDSLEMGGTNGVQLHEDLGMNKSESSTQSKVPSLTIQEIVNRVRSNPGDPCILETQEPLQDLIRGVLKIFSSRTAPLGAKGWKSLALYEKSSKSWSWTGPVPKSLSEHEVSEEVTSPEAWLLPHKMLVKLVDAFANWLKRAQETLQKIGSLPNPPLSLLQFNADEKERFRDLRAQKSLNTITPSTEDIREYFRKEEFLRYSIPDRAFSYTAIDGRKSIVAPLRRCGGKPTSKARDHFMLKRDRPPHVTILCLVRDAASRLPGSIGTRADVCTLIRDSQYIVEDVSDAQVNQVVSGALDRLHYERDPCVQFDAERKLWVYLHRDREEEDFEDDGTSSTKKWKRQKKEAPEPFEQEAVTIVCQEGGEQSGLTLGSDLNAEPSYEDEHKTMNPLYYDGNHKMEDSLGISGGLELGAMHQSSAMDWESLGLTSTRDDKFLCQENSKNDDFDDMFVREPPDQFLSTSLS